MTAGALAVPHVSTPGLPSTPGGAACGQRAARVVASPRVQPKRVTPSPCGSLLTALPTAHRWTAAELCWRRVVARSSPSSSSIALVEAWLAASVVDHGLHGRLTREGADPVQGRPEAPHAGRGTRLDVLDRDPPFAGTPLPVAEQERGVRPRWAAGLGSTRPAHKRVPSSTPSLSADLASWRGGLPR